MEKLIIRYTIAAILITFSMLLLFYNRFTVLAIVFLTVTNFILNNNGTRIKLFSKRQSYIIIAASVLLVLLIIIASYFFGEEYRRIIGALDQNVVLRQLFTIFLWMLLMLILAKRYLKEKANIQQHLIN